jgi:hypothetical protein
LRGITVCQSTSRLVSPLFLSRGTLATTTTTTKKEDYKPILDDILRKAPITKVVNTIEKDPRVRLPLNEFLELCKKEGVSDAEAKQVIRALHDSGKALHYENSPQLNNVIFIKPQHLTASLAKILDAEGHYTDEFIKQKQAELEAFQKEFETLAAKKSELDQIAYRKADNIIKILFGYLVIQGALVARLTWWELSWDVMEPVTYMLTFTTAVGGMAYFMSTRTEYTYEGLRKHLAQKRMPKIYRRNNFDLNRYNELEARMAKVTQQLANPELSLLTRPLDV